MLMIGLMVNELMGSLVNLVKMVNWLFVWDCWTERPCHAVAYEMLIYLRLLAVYVSLLANRWVF